MEYFTKKSESMAGPDINSIDSIFFKRIFSITYYKNNVFILSEECDCCFSESFSNKKIIKLFEEAIDWIKNKEI